MKSENSYFNKTLFKKNITGCWPLWFLVSFFGTIIVLGSFTSIGLFFGARISEYQFGVLYSVAVIVNPSLAMIYAVICAYFSWRHLFKDKTTAFMHSLPVKREGIFLTNSLSGFVIMNIPYAAVGLISIIASIVFDAFSLSQVLVTIVYILGENLFFFAMATLVAFITGNGGAMCVIYLVINFVAALLESVITSLASGFLYGVNTIYNGYFEFLCPVIMMTKKLWNSSEVPVEKLENTWIIGVYAAVGLVLFFAALVLYKKRKSEMAGEVVAVGWLRTLFKYAAAVVCAIVGGQAVYNIIYFGRVFAIYKFLPLLICVVVMGIIGLFAAEMLLKKTIRIFNKKFLMETALLAVVLAAFCAAFRFDVFGAETKTAKAENIEKITVVYEGTEFDIDSEDKELFEKVLKVHNCIIENRETIKKELNYNIVDLFSFYPEGSGMKSLEIEYSLKDGSSFGRSYNFNGECIAAADEMFKDSEIKKVILEQKGWKISSIEITNWFSSDSEAYVSLNLYDHEEIIKALLADIDNVGIDTTMTGAADSWAGVNIRISYEKHTENDYVYRSVFIPVNDGLKNTVSLLIEKNYLDPESTTKIGSGNIVAPDVEPETVDVTE